MTSLFEKSSYSACVCVWCVFVCILMQMPHNHQKYFLAFPADGFYINVDVFWMFGVAQITFSSHKNQASNIPSVLSHSTVLCKCCINEAVGTPICASYSEGDRVMCCACRRHS